MLEWVIRASIVTLSLKLEVKSDSQLELVTTIMIIKVGCRSLGSKVIFARVSKQWWLSKLDIEVDHLIKLVARTSFRNWLLIGRVIENIGE